jgi:putative FmdB family regulatory protein
MPYFEYECQNCGDTFEVMETYTEHEVDAEEHCPICGSLEIEHIDETAHVPVCELP